MEIRNTNHTAWKGYATDARTHQFRIHPQRRSTTPSKATSGACSMGFPACAHCSLLADAWRFATQTTQPGKAMLRTPELINSASILNEDPPPRRRRRVVPVAWAFQPVLTAACLRMHGDSQHKPHSLERLCYGRQNSSKYPALTGSSAPIFISAQSPSRGNSR